MATAKFDDGLLANEKIIHAGATACWLWFASVLYCRRGLTDGLIPRIVVPTLVVGLKTPFTHAKRLVEVRLWDTEGKDFRVHDFLDWNPSKAQIEGYRANDRERKQSKHKGQSDSTRNPNGIQPDSERLPDDEAVTTHADAKSASVSVSASAVCDPGGSEESARETISPAWKKPTPRVGLLVDGRAIRAHAGHAWCCDVEALCILDGQHRGYRSRLRSRANPDAELFAWYPTVLAKYDGVDIGDNRFKFWDNEFEQWIGSVTAAPSNGKETAAAYTIRQSKELLDALRPERPERVRGELE